VALIDCDLRNPSLHGYLGLPNAVGTSTVIAGRAALDAAVMAVDLRPGTRITEERGQGVTPVAMHQAVVRGTVAALGKGALQAPGSGGYAGRFLALSSGPVPPNPGELVASVRFSRIIDEVAEWVDLVILDAPALLLVGDAGALSTSVDGLLYVVNPMVVRRPQLERAADQLAQLPCRKLGLIVVQTRAIETRYHYRGYYYRKSQGTAPTAPAPAPAVTRATRTTRAGS
jgi:Mrp family chromosome partitioning ATPase